MAWAASDVEVFVALSAICAFVYWLGALRVLEPVFRYVPPVLLIVFLPAALSHFGVIPRSSPTYDLMRDYALPFGLFLLVVTTDVRSVLRAGPRALALMLVGSVGVMLGALATFAAFHDALPPESWKAFAAIAGSWVGGGANFAAIQSAVDMPADLVGPAIVVDATIGYIWLGIVLTAASYQHVLARWYRPDPRLSEPLPEPSPGAAQASTEVSYSDVLIVLGVGLVCASLAMAAGAWAFELATAHWGSDSVLTQVLNAYALGILVVTVSGIALSLTPLRRLDSMGAPAISYAAQFLFFTSLGAQADFAAVMAVPLLLTAGVIWICIHIAMIAVAARALRAPMSLIAVCTIANVGGPSTAAVVGAQYGKSWASLGALLGLFGHLIGTLAGLACGALLLRIAS